MIGFILEVHVGDPGEPGNALSAARMAMAIARPDEARCDCGAGEQACITSHSENCQKIKALDRFGEVFDRETGRTRG